MLKSKYFLNLAVYAVKNTITCSGKVRQVEKLILSEIPKSLISYFEVQLLLSLITVSLNTTFEFFLVFYSGTFLSAGSHFVSKKDARNLLI